MRVLLIVLRNFVRIVFEVDLRIFGNARRIRMVTDGKVNSSMPVVVSLFFYSKVLYKCYILSQRAACFYKTPWRGYIANFRRVAMLVLG